MDAMASTESAPIAPRGTRWPFFSSYQCQGSTGMDVFVQDVSIVQGTTNHPFGFCFPPLVMVGHVLQHLAECRARAVVVVPDIRPFWYSRLGQAATKSTIVPAKGQQGTFVWPHHRDGIREFVYANWVMRAYELDLADTICHVRQ